VVLRSCGGSFQVFRLETGGPVIGLLRNSYDRGAYERGAFSHEAGDLLVLFTDGVSESMNARFEEWGEDNMIEFAKTCYAFPASEGLRRILSASQAFAAGASQHDDMTLVVLRVS
jgi:sigma-B regulation protein RsbU (phosphoserine phosphatase)